MADIKITVEKGYVGPLTLEVSDDLPALDPTATATLRTYTWSTGILVLEKNATLTAPASFEFDLELGDTAAPEKYRAELSVLDDGNTYPWHGEFRVDGFSNAGGSTAPTVELEARVTAVENRATALEGGAFGGYRMTWAAAAPTTGTWAQGDVVWNTGATAGGSPGWVCTAAGTPGTWTAMANLAA